MDKIRMITESVRCFYCGLWSLIPLVGLPIAVIGFFSYARARAAAGTEWNPAQRQLRWGSFLSWLGCLITLSLLIVIAYRDLWVGRIF